MKTLALLTSGGDAPGMNSAIRAIVKVAAARGMKTLGVEQGYDGLIDGQFRDLTVPSPGGSLLPDPWIDRLGALGGTVLGSARSSRFRDPPGRAEAAAQLAKAGAEGLIVIGGNGSLGGAHALATEHPSLRVIGIPASIDNDIGCTGTALGVDTALNTIVDACDRISDTARAHRRAFIIEVMGRDCGYLAMAAAIAAGADAVLFREQGRSEEAIVESVANVIQHAVDRQKQRVLILKSEGVSVPSPKLVHLLEQRFAGVRGLEIRATVLGHLVRGGSPTFMDRMVSGRLGYAAVEALVAGATDQMVAWTPPVPGGEPTADPAVRRFPLEQVLRETAAILDGTSELTKWRVQMMERVEGVLGL